jgi:hypothetical protein
MIFLMVHKMKMKNPQKIKSIYKIFLFQNIFHKMAKNYSQKNSLFIITSLCP